MNILKIGIEKQLVASNLFIAQQLESDRNNKCSKKAVVV